MACLEVHQKSVVHNASASGENVSNEIDEQVSSPTIKPSENERWIKEVEEKCECAFKGLKWPSKLPDEKRDAKIRKSMLSEEFSRPRSVTIGPFHRHQSTPITDKEKRLVVYLMNHLYKLDLAKIKDQGAGARTCYSDSDIPQTFKSDGGQSFREMLLLDSCFILFMLTSGEICTRVTCDGLMLLRPDSSKGQENIIMLDQYVMPRVAGILSQKDKIMLDLLIVDNQIPFFVIEELYKELKLEKPLYGYALEFFETIHPRSTQGHKSQNSPPEFSHLLHLFHWSRVPVPENKCNALRSQQHQLDDVFWEYYMPTAMNLRESATVLLEKNISGTSLDITFRERRLITTVGVINIPHLHIHEYSSRIFHNLIAFEMQRPSSDRRTMAFSVIMQNLLQSEEDVELLRRRGILANTCMTDYEIVNFFKSLSQLTKKDDMPIDVYILCRQVVSHYKHQRSRFYANAILKCFHNW